MIPPIGLILGVEMIRDGGSLAVAFQGTDSCEYWLFLPVRLNRLASGEVERLGYEAPVIVDRLLGQELPMSWQHAQAFLSQVRPWLEHERQIHWFGIISEAVRLRGKLPDGVDNNFGRSIPQRHAGQT